MYVHHLTNAYCRNMWWIIRDKSIFFLRVSYSGIWRCVVRWVAPDVACSLVCWTILRPWRWRRYVPPKRRVQLNVLHGVISQKMILFITTAVKTSNPTYCNVGSWICPTCIVVGHDICDVLRQWFSTFFARGPLLSFIHICGSTPHNV
jgi:hypothetical protein